MLLQSSTTYLTIPSSLSLVWTVRKCCGEPSVPNVFVSKIFLASKSSVASHSRPLTDYIRIWSAYATFLGLEFWQAFTDTADFEQYDRDESSIKCQMEWRARLSPCFILRISHAHIAERVNNERLPRSLRQQLQESQANSEDGHFMPRSSCASRPSTLLPAPSSSSLLGPRLVDRPARFAARSSSRLSLAFSSSSSSSMIFFARS